MSLTCLLTPEAEGGARRLSKEVTAGSSKEGYIGSHTANERGGDICKGISARDGSYELFPARAE